MEFSEKVLEDIIWDNAQSPEGRKLLQERGLVISGMMFRQVDLGAYGRADLITVEYIPHIDLIDVVVYELKKGCINVNALMQAGRYVTALQKHGLGHSDWNSDIDFSIRLIGDSIDKNGDFTFLYNELDKVEIYTYGFKLSGLYFNYTDKCFFYVKENINADTTKIFANYLQDEMIKAEKDDSNK